MRRNSSSLTCSAQLSPVVFRAPTSLPGDSTDQTRLAVAIAIGLVNHLLQLLDKADSAELHTHTHPTLEPLKGSPEVPSQKPRALASSVIRSPSSCQGRSLGVDVTSRLDLTSLSGCGPLYLEYANKGSQMAHRTPSSRQSPTHAPCPNLGRQEYVSHPNPENISELVASIESIVCRVQAPTQQRSMHVFCF